MKKKCIVCDIDGVIFDTAELLQKFESLPEAEKWNQFNLHATRLEVNVSFDLIDIIEAYAEKHRATVAFVTARSDVIYSKTLRQLLHYFNKIKTCNCGLYMRKEGDTSSAADVKEEILEQLEKEFDIVLAIDDEKENCEMFKRHGILTMQVY